MNIKKLLIYPLTLALVVGLASCGGGKSGDSDKDKEKDKEKSGKKEKKEGHEHPEGQEHPDNGGQEHPSDTGKTSSLTIEQFADAAKAHIQKEQKKNGGYFKVKDKKQDKKIGRAHV